MGITLWAEWLVVRSQRLTKASAVSMLRVFTATAIFMLLGGTLGVAATCNTPNSIISYRNFSSGGFEFVEFKFKKPATPDFTVSAATPPFSDTSDKVIPVAGALHTKIIFRGVDWMCTVQRFITTPKPAIKAVKLIDQFEGQLEFVIGRSAASHYYSTRSISAGAYQLVRLKFRR
jgi:hypothetical protein